MDKKLMKRIFLDGVLLEGDIPGQPENTIVVELDGTMYVLTIEEVEK